MTAVDEYLDTQGISWWLESIDLIGSTLVGAAGRLLEGIVQAVAPDADAETEISIAEPAGSRGLIELDEVDGSGTTPQQLAREDKLRAFFSTWGKNMMAQTPAKDWMMEVDTLLREFGEHKAEIPGEIAADLRTWIGEAQAWATMDWNVAAASPSPAVASESTTSGEIGWLRFSEEELIRGLGVSEDVVSLLREQGMKHYSYAQLLKKLGIQGTPVERQGWIISEETGRLVPHVDTGQPISVIQIEDPVTGAVWFARPVEYELEGSVLHGPESSGSDSIVIGYRFFNDKDALIQEIKTYDSLRLWTQWAIPTIQMLTFLPGPGQPVLTPNTGTGRPGVRLPRSRTAPSVQTPKAGSTTSYSVRGFRTAEQFQNAASRIRTATGADDVIVGVRGSAATGVRHSGGTFGAGSDIDFFVVSDKLYQQALAAGARPSAGALRVSATMRYFPQIHAIEKALSRELGRKVTVRIFSSKGFNRVRTGLEIISP